MGLFADKKIVAKSTGLILMALVLAGIGPFPLPNVFAEELVSRSITMSSGDAAESDVAYGVVFETATSAVVGSVLIQFCSNSSIVDDICEVPDGFSTAGAALVGQEGASGFVISPNGADNEILLTRPPTTQPADVASFDFSGITNPAIGGSYFARILTYATSNAAGPFTSAGGVALYYEPSLGISTEVPPHLTFCVGGSIDDYDCTKATDPFSDLGVLEAGATSLAQSQMVVATNADGGYTTWVYGATMTSGNNVLPAMEGDEAKKGVSQFGINLSANTNPIVGQDAAGPGLAAPSTEYGTPNEFRFKSGDVLATIDDPDDFRRYTISYIVNVKKDQPGGVYSTTLTYLTLANF